MEDRITEAYRIVLNDMLNSECSLLVGEYNANHDNKKFMYGISTVMEWIAYKVSEAEGNAFSDMFVNNMIKCEQEAKGIKCYKCAEQPNCWKGQNGGKVKCKMFSPIA